MDDTKYIVVTGGAGFIGRHLVRSAREQGQRVLVIDAGYTGRLEELPDDVEVLHRDIADLTPREWDQALAGADAVFHLAARKYNTPGVTSEELLATNVTATQHLIEGCLRVGVGRLVLTSSLYAYGSLGPDDMSELDVPLPRTVYGASKLMGENLLRAAGAQGLSWNAARLFFIYGPGQHADGGYKSVIVTNFENLAAGRAPTVCGDGTQELDYVYIADAVEALWVLAQGSAHGQVVNVCAGVGRRIVDLTAAMQEVAGAGPETVTLAPDWTAGTRRVGNPAYCAEAVGWTASTSLHTGLAQTWQSLRP